MAYSVKEAQRAMHLVKKRQKEQEEIEIKRKKIEEDLKLGSIHNKFAAHYDAVEQKLKSDTVGLVTLTEMKAKQEDVIKEREKQLAIDAAEARLKVKQERDRKKQDKKQKAALSFNFEDEDEEEEQDADDDVEVKKEPNEETDEGEIPPKRKRFGKDPNVDTSFLPDRDREVEDNKVREELRQEWAEKQELMKNELIEITYSYWDGSGHRKQIRMKKGNSIQQFLHRCLENLKKDFNELRGVSVDQLMYVKEDLIIPQHYTFYDFIVTKARGKSGPLFNFDVHEDVRIISDARVEKDESHAGKVTLRSWYERNKHIFPASRWEPYDPEKSWEHYTVSDKEAVKIVVK